MTSKRKTKKEKCKDILKYITEVSNTHISNIANDIKCDIRTVYRALSDLRKEQEEQENAETPSEQQDFQADSTISRISDFKPQTFKSKKEAEKDFVEFVGFRGYTAKQAQSHSQVR